jgi:lantibiotic modifying enzyme
MEQLERTIRWQPVLEGDMRLLALRRLDEIAARLVRADVATAGPSLAGGAAGISLFFAYRAQATGSDLDAETAVRFVEDALDQAARTEHGPELHEGYVGVAWTLAHLERSLVDLGGDDPGDVLEHALLELVGRPRQGEFDLIGGLAGIGVYALERLPRAGAAELLELVVERLAEAAEHEGDFATWLKSPDLVPDFRRAEFPRGYYDLGVAHGVPGVVALLAHALRAGVDAARGPLGQAVRWTLAQRLPPQSPSAFASFAAAGFEPQPARSAWCYGDPGASAALLLAARAAGEPRWSEEALAVALRAAARPAADCGVTDASLCHGAAGLGHVYGRLAHLTGDATLADAARFWLERALAHELPEDDGLLVGAAGVGLALLAAATDVQPAWDASLLLSTPSR